MTALCGGGASGPQSGVTGVLALGAAAIEVFLAGIGFAEVAPILAPIIVGLIDIDIANYCATDPPADPGLTALDILTAVAVPPSADTFTAQQKIATWFEHRYWWQICHCTTTTTPAPPTLSDPGPAVINPGLPKGNYTKCWNATVPWFRPAYSGTGQIAPLDLSAQGLPGGVPILTNFFGAGVGVPPVNAVPIDPGIVQMVFTLTVNEAIVSTTQTVNAGTSAWNGDGSQFATASANQVRAIVDHGDPSPQTGTLAAMGNLTDPRWWAMTVQNGDSVAHTGTVTLSFNCPPGLSYGAPCCPPDPLIEGELQQILQYVQAIYAGLAIPPSSFSEGTVHSGLVGNGSITFSGVPIALKVDLTTIPSWVGLEVGNPDFYFDVGYLSFGTSEGNYAQSRLELEHQVLTVPVLAGSVGYTLKNGVVATITELLPGP